MCLQPALQLHVDLRPGVVDAIAHAHKVVVHRDKRDDENHDNGNDDDNCDGKSAHDAPLSVLEFQMVTV